MIFNLQYLTSVQTEMKELSSEEFSRITEDMVWDQIASTIDSSSGEERLLYPISSPTIDKDVAEAELRFSDLLSKTMLLAPKFNSRGLKVMRSEFEDSMSFGAQQCANWARDMGSLFKYHPQDLTLSAVRANGVTQYDGINFFSASRPVNPAKLSLGTYANLFTGAASGVYPGALKIDESISVDVAARNFGKARAYIRGLKMPNGVTPRKLRIKALLVPPALENRAAVLLGAKFLPATASSGAGTVDANPIISSYGFGVKVVDELGAGYPGGSDTSWYLLMEQVQPSIGAFVYLERTPFAIDYFDFRSDSEMNAKQEFQWAARGRNSIEPGLPHLMFRADAA